MKPTTLLLLGLGMCVLSSSCAVQDAPAQRSPTTGTTTNAGDLIANPVDPGIISDLTGEWENELGSTLIIRSVDAATGAISGAYRSPSGTPGSDFPLSGWVNTQPAD